MENLTSLDFATSAKSNKFTTFMIVMLFFLILFIIVAYVIYLKNNVTIIDNCTVKPPVPENVAITRINSTTLNVGWLISPTATSYNIYIGLAPNFTREQKLIKLTAGPVDNLNITSLPTGSIYYILVSAQNKCGESDNSIVASFNFV